MRNSSQSPPPPDPPTPLSPLPWAAPSGPKSTQPSKPSKPLSAPGTPRRQVLLCLCITLPSQPVSPRRRPDPKAKLREHCISPSTSKACAFSPPTSLANGQMGPTSYEASFVGFAIDERLKRPSSDALDPCEPRSADPAHVGGRCCRSDWSLASWCMRVPHSNNILTKRRLGNSSCLASPSLVPCLHPPVSCVLFSKKQRAKGIQPASKAGRRDRAGRIGNTGQTGFREPCSGYKPRYHAGRPVPCGPRCPRCPKVFDKRVMLNESSIVHRDEHISSVLMSIGSWEQALWARTLGPF